MPQFLFGPSDEPVFADRFVADPVTAGRWRAFGAACPSFAAAVGDGTVPDAVLLWPGYASVPAWVWAVPVPVVALAHDPNLLVHSYRHLLPLADLVLTDAPSAVRLRAAGLEHVRAANLFGLDRHFVTELDAPEGDRDLDVVFAGNLSAAVQRDRGAWLGRLAALGDRFRVRIAMGVFGADYRALLRRAKLVFNRSIRGECNLRALEAAAAGAVLLQEADNAEVVSFLKPGVEYAQYTATDFEAVVERLLADEGERRQTADRARERVRGYAFDTLVEAAVGVNGPDWAAVVERAVARAATRPRVPLSGRVWVRSALAGLDADPELAADLAAAGNHHGLAVLAPTPAAAEPHLAAAAVTNRVSAAGHALALAALGRGADAVAVLRGLLASLDAAPELTAAEQDTVPHPVRFDHTRVGWERAAFAHPGDAAAEGHAKHALLVGRAALALAELTGELDAYRRAADATPEVPAVRAAYGAALARAGRAAEGVPHLRWAADHDPFDAPAARALGHALTETGDASGAAAVRVARARMVRVAPGLVAAPAPAVAPPPAAPVPVPAPVGVPPGTPRTRFVPLSAEAFAARFGTPDTSAALVGYTPAGDTAAVLALVAHARPRRVLEVGTALGHMTANLTAFAPPDAVVYSLGLVGGAEVVPAPRSGAAAQEVEVPGPADFARFVDHFGTARRARLVPADSRTFDFASLAPLDFAFIDGGHDRATARSDSLGAYRALRPGGCLVWHDLPSPVPWVEVERAVAELALPEPVYTVEGTRVAFLFKGEGAGATATADTARVAIAWEGEFAAVHSLAAVNRGAVGELARRGHAVAAAPSALRAAGATPFVLPPELAACVGATVPPGAVTVRHRWPPDLSVPSGPGPLVLFQPWEFGRVPRAWVEPILSTVDEVWAYSRAVLRAYVASGVPEDRVALVPPGVDPDRFRPGLDPLVLPTDKPVKLLYVGGTIPRKGFDVLLAAFARAFRRSDPVALVVKDMGAGTFYRDQTAGAAVAALRADPAAPEVVYLTDDLSEPDLTRLYAACDALVHPYRGEGFGLPVLEAMACGVPVAVTAGGPTDEFVPPGACWRVPARLNYFPEDRVGDLATVGRPWWLEPDADSLVAVLREIASDAAGRARRGGEARRAALGWTWARTAAAVEDRVRVLRARTPVRFRALPRLAVATPAPVARAAAAPFVVSAGAAATAASAEEPVPAVAKLPPRVSLTMIVKNEEHNLGDCLASVRDLVDEAVVVDTGSTDRTREVAASFGAVVGTFPWVDHFAAARNAALDHATGDYVLWMDADDRLDADNRVKLRALLAGLTGGNDAYVMKCLCIPDRPGAGATVVDHVRLFRRAPAHRWTFRVHEQILPALRASGADVRWADVTVQHVGYVDPALRRRKLDRDLRLLRIDHDEHPDSPFTLFNLGSVYRELGDHAAAADALERSLRLSHPRDSIVRKLYAMLAQSRAALGDPGRAAAAVAEGRGHYPADAELLFLAANLERERGRPKAAEALYRELIGGTEGAHFASVDAGLRAVRGRHNLAVLLLEQKRYAEAEGLWRAALVADPQFVPAHQGLGDAYAATGNGVGVAGVAVALRELGPEGRGEAANLDARWHLTRKDLAAALAAVDAGLAESPNNVGLRVTRSHVLLARSAPPGELEAAFRAVLEADPNNGQARHNLRVVLRNTGRSVEGVIDPPVT